MHPKAGFGAPPIAPVAIAERTAALRPHSFARGAEAEGCDCCAEQPRLPRCVSSAEGFYEGLATSAVAPPPHWAPSERSMSAEQRVPTERPARTAQAPAPVQANTRLAMRSTDLSKVAADWALQATAAVGREAGVLAREAGTAAAVALGTSVAVAGGAFSAMGQYMSSAAGGAWQGLQARIWEGSEEGSEEADSEASPDSASRRRNRLAAKHMLEAHTAAAGRLPLAADYAAYLGHLAAEAGHAAPAMAPQVFRQQSGMPPPQDAAGWTMLRTPLEAHGHPWPMQPVPPMAGMHPQMLATAGGWMSVPPGDLPPHLGTQVAGWPTSAGPSPSVSAVPAAPPAPEMPCGWPRGSLAIVPAVPPLHEMVGGRPRYGTAPVLAVPPAQEQAGGWPAQSWQSAATAVPGMAAPRWPAQARHSPGAAPALVFAREPTVEGGRSVPGTGVGAVGPAAAQLAPGPHGPHGSHAMLLPHLDHPCGPPRSQLGAPPVPGAPPPGGAGPPRSASFAARFPQVPASLGHAIAARSASFATAPHWPGRSASFQPLTPGRVPVPVARP